MNSFRKIAFLAFAFLVITASGNPLLAQQKYGHLNYGNLLEQMPDMKAANTTLTTYRDQLIKIGEGMAAKLQQDYNELQDGTAKGIFTAIQIQQKQTQLETDQQKIGAYEQEVIQKVGAKRDEILKPIVEKVNNAIDEVGKENGYAMIFDTSLFNTVLFAEDSDDVMPLVKKKLGLQ